MGIGRGKNRRRADASQRAHALRGAVTTFVRAVVRVTAAVAIVSAIVFGGRAVHHWALTSPRFALASVSVEGTRRADPIELSRSAGLVTGANLFELDVGAVARTIESHPWVESAEVTRHLPSGVSIRVVEHEPAAMVALGDLYLLDGKGVPFKRLQAGDEVDLPLVTGIDREGYVKDPAGAAASFTRALDALSSWSSGAKAERVSEVRVEDRGLTLVTSAGTEVRFGDQASPEKLARLERVRAELARRRLSADVIHLENRVRPGWVAVKLSISPSERGSGSNP